MALDGETAELLRRLAAMGGGRDRDLGVLEPEAARAASRFVWDAFVGEDRAEVDIASVEIPGPAGGIPARLYRPRAHAAGPRPVVVFLHGGGWAMGDLDGYEPLVKALCAGSGAAFLAVDYRLAPEHPFPAGLEDALAAVRWAAAEADARGLDGGRLAVMGDSAGGNLATVAARRLHAAGEVRLAAQFLIYPMLDVASPHWAYPSRLRHGDGDYLLARRDIEVTAAWYLGDRVEPAHPDVSPLFTDDLGMLPPTVILTAGFDPLLDEARRYRDRLLEAGVRVEFKCFEGTIHAFLSLGTLAVAHAGRAWLAGRVARHLGA